MRRSTRWSSRERQPRSTSSTTSSTPTTSACDALDTRTFYVVPRVNPDGADAGLADGRFRRSSVRPYPRDEPEDGLHREDVDGDGRVLFMRMKDAERLVEAAPGRRAR